MSEASYTLTTSSIPLRYVADINPSVDFSELDDDAEVTFLPMDRVKSGYFIPNTDRLSKLASSYNSFEDGDIVLAKVTPCFENGNIAITENLANGKGFGSSELFVIRPNGIEQRFLFYCLQSAIFKQEGEASMTGAGGLKRISSDVLKQHRVRAFPRQMQRRIATYLDRETARIDALVAEKERMLALLEQKRAALISRAVTCGLNPKAPTKPSGLDWLGEIPKHWDVRRVKFLIDGLTQGSSPQASSFPAEAHELGVLKLSAISRGRFYRMENKALRSAQDDEVHPDALQSGDVLVTRSNTPSRVGDACFVPCDEPNLLIPDLVYRLRVNQSRILPEFLVSYLITASARTEIVSDARGSSGTMVKISQDHVSNWRIPVPPLAEQEAIIAHIRSHQTRAAALESALRDSIALLKERRSALISAAVTGKIDF